MCERKLGEQNYVCESCKIRDYYKRHLQFSRPINHHKYTTDKNFHETTINLR